MEAFITTAASWWDKFAGTGAYAIRKFFYALNGWEMGETTSLVIFVGALGGLVLALLLLAKKQKKTHFLMESGKRYHRR